MFYVTGLIVHTTSNNNIHTNSYNNRRYQIINSHSDVSRIDTSVDPYVQSISVSILSVSAATVYNIFTI